MTATAPTPELLTAVGHALLRSVAIGQGDILRSAAGAIERLERMLPDASAEARLVATLLAISSDHPAQPVVASPAPTQSPAPVRRQAKDKPAKTSRKSKASNPRMDSSGKLLPSREINGIAVVSQAEARKALGVSCVQMLRLENQRLLKRIQEPSSRLVFYAVAEIQTLLDMIDRTQPPPL